MSAKRVYTSSGTQFVCTKTSEAYQWNGMGHDTNRLCEMAIAENYIGVVFGRGGTQLRRVTRDTGASIRVSQKGRYVPGTRNRIVTITGEPEQVAHAHDTIAALLKREMQKRTQQH